MRITVIGSGRRGTFLAWYADRLGHAVRLFGRESSPRFQALLRGRSNGLVTLSGRVELPIRNAVYAVLYQNADIRRTLGGLFDRSLKMEF